MAAMESFPGPHGLDPVQQQIARADSSVLLLGAAGTGKTAALRRASVTSARRDGVAAVLALARNRAAAREWQGWGARALRGLAPPVHTVAAVAGAIVADAAGSAEAPRILTAPEQEMRVRELLRGSIETGSVAWPVQWKPALATRAFAGRLRRCLAHARRLGWEPHDLARLAAERGDAGWEAIAAFLGEYLQVLDWEGALDHVEVVLRALRIASTGVPTRYRGVATIVADDVHEWDVSQARLVLALTGSGARLIAAADPDQCTASYRGADLAAVALVREHTGATLTCPMLYLGGAAARDARRSLFGQRWYAGLPAAAMAPHRGVAAVSRKAAPLVAREFDDPHAQARHVAAQLRARHVSGVPWREMAVLTSSPRAELPLLARGLAHAGIPVHVPAADVALAEQSPVATLVTAATVCLDPDDERAWRDGRFERLLTSDMADITPRELRRLRRWARLGEAEGRSEQLTVAPAPDGTPGSAEWAPPVAGPSSVEAGVPDGRASSVAAGVPDEGAPAAEMGPRRRASAVQRGGTTASGPDRSATGGAPARSPASGASTSPGDALRRVLDDAEFAAAAPTDLQHVVAAVRGLADRLSAARAAHQRDATPAEVLWELWVGVPDASGRSWPDRLHLRSRGSGERALAADRDLDAAIHLFRLAERAPQRWGGRRALGALLDEIEHQEIPAEPDLSSRPVADRVELLSLHRAQGRSWQVAVVTGLTASGWETGELGAGIAPPERLTETDLLPAASQHRSAEQRRLFNVALSRGDELLLAACGGPSDPPTSFLADAGIPVERVRGLPEQPQTAVDVMLRLRAAAAAAAPRATRSATYLATTGHQPRQTRGQAGQRSPASIEQPNPAAGAEELALLLSAPTGQGAPMFRGMTPQRWPGAQGWTIAPQPLRRSGPVTLSASAVAALSECPMRWFLQREAGGDRPTGVPAQFGLIVHAATAELVRAGADAPRDLSALLARHWTGTGYEAPWQEAQERKVADESLHRAATWLASRSGRLAAELPLDQPVDVVDEHGNLVAEVRIRGSIDLTETRTDQRLVWDFKTGRAVPTVRDTATNPQLAVYQLALRAQPGPPVTGAGLVHLCTPERRSAADRPATRGQPGVDTDPATADHAMSLLRQAVGVVRGETFPATPGRGCRTCPFATSCPAKRPDPTSSAGDRERAAGQTTRAGGEPDARRLHRTAPAGTP